MPLHAGELFEEDKAESSVLTAIWDANPQASWELELILGTTSITADIRMVSQ